MALSPSIVPRPGAADGLGALFFDLPSREDLQRLWRELSLEALLRDYWAPIIGDPARQRLVIGGLVALIGVAILIVSYRRSRPSQAELVRLVAARAQTSPDVLPALPIVPAQGTAPIEPPEARARHASEPPRPLPATAYLLAEQDSRSAPVPPLPIRQDLVRIGRHSENDIQFVHKSVHRYHAVLHRTPEGPFAIKDLSGRAGNGVYLNGARIDQAQLRSGDLVELGAIRLRFKEAWPA
jgi:hypothetical protein